MEPIKNPSRTATIACGCGRRCVADAGEQSDHLTLMASFIPASHSPSASQMKKNWPDCPSFTATAPPVLSTCALSGDTQSWKLCSSTNTTSCPALLGLNTARQPEPGKLVTHHATRVAIAHRGGVVPTSLPHQAKASVVPTTVTYRACRRP